MTVLQQIRGMVVPLPTPFDGDGEIDEALLGDMAEYYVEKGADAYFLFGSYGQGPAMSVPQRKRALEVIVKAVGDAVPLVPQIGAVDPYTARDLALHARDQGVQAIAMVGPYYYADRSDAELTEHVRFVASAAQLPVLLYNNPRYQGYSFTPEKLAALREQVPAIFGVKMAKGSLGDILAYRNALGPDFTLFAPNENLYPGMLVGQSGTISPPLTTAIELGVALVRAIDERRSTDAERLQVALLQFASRLKPLNRWGRAVRAAGLRHIGFAVKQYPRWPTPPLPEKVRVQVGEAIDAARAAATA